MDPKIYLDIRKFCSNLEELIRLNFHDCKDYLDRKVILDLLLSVINYQNFFEKKGLKNGNEKI